MSPELIEQTLGISGKAGREQHTPKLIVDCNAPNFGLVSALCRMHDLLIFYCMDLISAYVCLTALSEAGIS